MQPSNNSSPIRAGDRAQQLRQLNTLNTSHNSHSNPQLNTSLLHTHQRERETMNSPGLGVGGSNREDTAAILAVARRHLQAGDPAAALQAVVAALRNTGGEQAVTSALKRAREVYENGIRVNEAADELTALFAQCAIATLPDAPEQMSIDTSTSSQMDVSHRGVESSILAESGREQVVYDASSDGSSFLCHQCGGVVSNSRRDEHFAYWCPATLRN